MNQTSLDQDGWQHCPSGQVRSMVNDLQVRRRTRCARRTATVMLCLLCIGAGYMALQPQRDDRRDYGGIGCTEVHRHASAYVDGTLDPQIAAQIKRHLAQCDHCRTWMADFQSRSTWVEPSKTLETARLDRSAWYASTASIPMQPLDF